MYLSINVPGLTLHHLELWGEISTQSEAPDMNANRLNNEKLQTRPGLSIASSGFFQPCCSPVSSPRCNFSADCMEIVRFSAPILGIDWQCRKKVPPSWVIGRNGVTWNKKPAPRAHRECSAVVLRIRCLKEANMGFCDIVSACTYMQCWTIVSPDEYRAVDQRTGGGLESEL
jgi:hypothetical protein